MAASHALFLLMLITQGNGPFSMTQIRSFDSKAACTTAQQSIQKAVGQTPGIGFMCISESSAEDLEKANR